MGVLQALEAIKLLILPAPSTPTPATMTLFSAWPQLAFRHCRMRARRTGCPGCSPAAERTALADTDYVAFCGADAEGVRLAPEERVAPVEYRSVRESGASHVLLDVRDPTQFGICHLRGSWSGFPSCVCMCVVPVLTCVDVPFEEFEGASALPALVKEGLSTAEAVYVLCRLGNDSQIVTRMLKDAGVAGGHVWDVRGGIREWARTAPEGFPEY